MKKEKKIINHIIWIYFATLFSLSALYAHVQSILKYNFFRCKLYISKKEVQRAELLPGLNNALFFKTENFITILFILGLIFNNYTFKRHNNKILKKQQNEIDEQNKSLEKLAAEKEWLLQEIHHRVKNNLQIVISLLNSQSAYLDNQDALMAIKNSQYRMFAMSLIHQKLYESDNLSYIDMSWYIFELVEKMKEWFETQAKINFILDIEVVFLDVAQAIPLGLIINELVNNAVKHAFPLETKGDVYISLKNIENNKYLLIISDTGIGVPENFEIKQDKSLGMNLIIGLTEQIGGVFELKNENGLKIIITFTRNREFEISIYNSENI